MGRRGGDSFVTEWQGYEIRVTEAGVFYCATEGDLRERAEAKSLAELKKRIQPTQRVSLPGIRFHYYTEEPERVTVVSFTSGGSLMVRTKDGQRPQLCRRGEVYVPDPAREAKRAEYQRAQKAAADKLQKLMDGWPLVERPATATEKEAEA